MRYRKNINCLTTNELHDLREALAAMYALPASDSNSFAATPLCERIPMPTMLNLAIPLCAIKPPAPT